MQTAVRLSVWRFLLICTTFHVLSWNHAQAMDNVIPTDYSNMTCHLANGKEGICVYAYLCQNDVINTDGTAILDLRFSDDCVDYFLKCCSKESACLENTGTCLPRTQCKANLDLAKYKEFKQTDDCDWSGYQCCPNDMSGEDGTAVDGVDGAGVKKDEGTDDNCGVDSICVPHDQCLVKPDGVNLVQANSSVCNGPTTCCPLVNVNKTSSNSSTNSSEGKTCDNGNGVCTSRSECKGTVHADGNKKCGELICCSRSDGSDTSGENTDPPPTSTKRPDVSTCGEMGGTCESRRKCQQETERSSSDCEYGTVCCQSAKSEPDLELKECGYRMGSGIIFDTINRENGESQYGEFPWMVAIMINNAAKASLSCGGTLINPEVVITTADCAKKFWRTPNKLTIRAGEWDMGANMEPIPFQERRVAKIIYHPEFKHTTLVNNIALLFLDDKFDLSPAINTICLPPQDFTIDNGELIATGWGTTPQNRTKYQQILKYIDLTYTPKTQCERILRRATSNKKFQLHSSFFCAGGQVGLDTCKGDGGSPVVFPIPDDFDSRYYAVGMVSWGVGCGRSSTPAVYTDIGQFRDWIDGEIDKEGLHMQYYDYVPQKSSDEV
ncbi:phenoloxidase-activating factor 2-like [Armigeres subalbatus]|uniref:phenoloxidase-activating factor 2-like n=1 Tax=Armigeres subalbatus TaxID=124917 RepID=UPI002ED32D83